MKFSFPSAALLSVALAGLAAAQHVGTLTPEVHPKLSWTKCTTAGGCANQPASVVLDANWRWLHSTSGSTNCYDGNAWNPTLCPNEATCTANCAVEGADYTGTYGITTSGNSITHKFVQQGAYSTNIGSRVYLMDSTDQKYEMFYLLNKEFTFDADVSNLVCGLNGALYFVEMEADGGLKHTTNKAGAKYGTGYCDAQCPHDIKYISGKANVEGWSGSASDPNAGNGRYGTCCPEMDIWEANNIANAYTPHACTHPAGPFRCDGIECGDGSDRYNGVCDKDGCDINTYRMGNLNFYGPGSGFTIDTTKKVTVVTQFITDTGTASGNLVEIRRKWVQNGIIYETPTHNVPGHSIPGNSISDAFCDAQKTAFGDINDYAAKGHLKAMGDSLKRGHVLVMSIWADHAVQMRWLDSQWPLDKPASDPGVTRGTCPTNGSAPDTIVQNNPNASVQFSNIRFGDIDSTYSGTPANPGSGGTSTTTTASSTSTATSSTRTSTSTTTTTTSTRSTTSTTAVVSPTAAPGNIPKWQQCGGINWNGSGTCVAGSTCTVLNPYYSQCL